MRVSLGTAKLLNLKNTKNETLPTLAYLMYGEGCKRNCKFCSQAVGAAGVSELLSRVTWPEYDFDIVLDALTKAKHNGDIRRCCVQVVDSGPEEELTEKIRFLRETGLSICLSKNVQDIKEVKSLIELGVDKVSIAIDVANPTLYGHIKGGCFEERLKLLLDAGKIFPGKISTHIIIGLGETEEEVLRLMDKLNQYNIHIGLFAFTPVKGTQMAHVPPPDEGIYRRVQIARFLISVHGYTVNDFEIRNTKIAGIKKINSLEHLCDGKAFETSGCPDCNRPYYNERPRGVMYNYPRPLTREEIYDALVKSLLFSNEAIDIVLGRELGER